MQCNRLKNLFLFHSFILAFIFSPRSTHALEMDWSGQFWSEFNGIANYTLRGVNTPCDPVNGYCISSSGTKDAYFQTLFLRLRPRLILNDNISIHSEWWVGDPVYGMFGNALPYSSDQCQYDASFSRGSGITAQRFWAEWITNVGTVQVGRIPLHWGLGTVWNSGEAVGSHYLSTGDALRWIAKFGAFSFIPSFMVHSVGNSIGGGAVIDNSGNTTALGGKGILFDYSIALKYENLDEGLELGVNLIRRFAGVGQDTLSGVRLPAGTSGMINYTLYDLFGKKQFSDWSVAGEIPIVNGFLGSMRYQTFSVATEFGWKASDAWDFFLKAGYVPGQKNFAHAAMDEFGAFYLHPNYHIGMILLNYQFQHFSKIQTQNNPKVQPQNLQSPYYNPIVNAGYFALSGVYQPWDKWTLKPAILYATALQSAAKGQYFYNTWTRVVDQALTDQGKNLGWEIDLGVTFQWDDVFHLSFDQGVFFPGSFYAFSNSAIDGELNLFPAYAMSIKLGLNF